MTDYAAVLTALHPDRLWLMTGNDYGTLVIHDGGAKPTKKSLDAAWPEIQYQRDLANVEAARRARYQTETDGLFFAAQREGGDLTVWQAAVDAIKADLPKPQKP
jgi:hypothetical protein